MANIIYITWAMVPYHRVILASIEFQIFGNLSANFLRNTKITAFLDLCFISVPLHYISANVKKVSAMVMIVFSSNCEVDRYKQDSQHGLKFYENSKK